MSEVLDFLKDMDKEFGGSSDYTIEDGTYFVTYNADGSRIWEADGKEGAFLVSWRIDSGEYAGRTVTDFIRWHSDNEDTAKLRHSLVTQMIRGVTMAQDESVHPAIKEAYVALMQTQGEEESLEALENLATTFEGVRMPLRLVTSKTGYQNTRYIEKGGPVKASDPREIAAVAV